MDELRIAAYQQPTFVALKMLKAAQRNAAEGFDRRLLVVDWHRFALEGAERFVQEELVSSLGLAGDGRVEINRLLKLAGQGEDVIDLAGK